ncbi:MAG: FAD-dependent monooxygenase [Kordiimonadaceae bacterium]|nr:FAD-dependent monooxygenase [Kordiimonadaceae bacterium]
MTEYDAIIVGARCGGAPTAMLLARAGHKVLLVDRMAFGSDIMSTHFIKRTGASRLNDWGLLDAIRDIGTPAIEHLSFNIDDITLKGNAPAYKGIDADFTPRRKYLDKILVDAAIEAGVEVREKFRVDELIFDEDRVVGIKGTGKNGTQVSERAKVIVGADGTNSFVGNSVKAECHVDAGIHTCGFYAYHSGMREADNAAILNVLTDKRRFYINFPTNDDLDMVFLFWPTGEAKSVRKDVEAAYYESLKNVPELEARVRGGQRESRIMGTHMLPNFFRRAHGPGWALVGDAALHRCPITAQGITNAFTHAEILAEELCLAFGGDKNIDVALADYDRRQFEQLKPMFDYTVHLAMLQPTPDLVQKMLPLISQDVAATSAFMGAFLGSVPLNQVFPPELMERFASDVERGQRAVKARA